MISRAQRVVGRVEREREADRHVGLASAARCPGPSRRSRSPCAGGVMPRSGSRRQAASTCVEVHHRLAHAHEDDSGRRPRCGGSAAPGRGSRRPSGCGRTSSCRSRRTCRSAGSPTATTRTASGARRGSASARPRPARPSAVRKRALIVPSRDVRLVADLERRERHRARRAARAARRAGRSSPRSRRRRAPSTPTPAWRGRRARRRRRAWCSRSVEVHAAGERGDARTPRRLRLAKYLAHAASPRAARRRRSSSRGA